MPVAEADFAPVVTRPGKVICVGLNYRSHILETGRELPEYPTLFAKFAETLTGPHDDIAIPSVSERVDWEVELGVVIGRAGVPGHPGGGHGRHRRVHGDQRRVDAGLAAAHAAVAGGQDVRALARRPGRTSSRRAMSATRPTWRCGARSTAP